VSDPDNPTNADNPTNDHRAAYNSRVTAALVGGVLLGAIVAVATVALSRQSFGGGLGWECTPSGSTCDCKGISDCLLLGRSGKCDGKRLDCDEDTGKCVCF
jgi:hypothetical protein